jgi:hypothetical protein
MQQRTIKLQQQTTNGRSLRQSLGGCSILEVRCFCFFCALLVLGFSLTARAQVSREYQLKAAFLYNFAQFTDWPPSAFAETNAPLVIGVLGADPFGSVLDETVKGETANGRKLVVERYRRAGDLKPCHILFISQSESRNVESILKKVIGKPTLTVSDADGPEFRDVMVRFNIEKNKVRFRINQDAVKASGLTLSSQLLRVAESAP